MRVKLSFILFVKRNMRAFCMYFLSIQNVFSCLDGRVCHANSILFFYQLRFLLLDTLEYKQFSYKISNTTMIVPTSFIQFLFDLITTIHVT